MKRNCNFCGRTYEAIRPQSKFCKPSCRVQNSRLSPLQSPPVKAVSRSKKARPAAKTATPAPISITPDPVSPPPGDSALVSIVRKELQDAGVLETIEGQQALQLAIQMSGRETAGGMSSLSKEFSRVKAEALRSAVPTVADPVDELQARRNAKMAAV